MQLKPETVEETQRIINPFVHAMKDQRLDQSYVTSLRKEVQILIDPFRDMCTDSLDRQDLLEAQLIALQASHNDF